MKKVFVVLMIMLLPLSAMAMTPVSDSELATVTGQVGVDIAVVDFHMNMSIGNLSWGDTDSTTGVGTPTLGGVMYVAGAPTNYLPGYININAINMTDIFVTLNAVKSYVGTLPIAIYADPMKIDVATLDAWNSTAQPFTNLVGKTAIVITMGDMHMQVGRITVGGIYLDGSVNQYTQYQFDRAHDSFASTFGTLDSTKNLGVMQIDAFDLVMYSSVGGYDTAANGSKFFPNNPARVYIMAH